MPGGTRAREDSRAGQPIVQRTPLAVEKHRDDAQTERQHRHQIPERSGHRGGHGATASIHDPHPERHLTECLPTDHGEDHDIPPSSRIRKPASDAIGSIPSDCRSSSAGNSGNTQFVASGGAAVRAVSNAVVRRRAAPAPVCVTTALRLCASPVLSAPRHYRRVRHCMRPRQPPSCPATGATSLAGSRRAAYPRPPAPHPPA